MTVESESSIIRYVYNGPGDYPFLFKTYEETDIKCFWIDDDALSTELAYPSEFTVEIVDGVDGGTVTTISPADAGGTLEIRRELPIEQSVDWVNNDPLDANTLERAFDDIVMILQQQQTQMDYSSALTNWTGTWQPLTVYEPNNLVQSPAGGTVSEGNIYVCVSAHTSTSDFDTDLASGLWRLVLDVGDIVVYRDECEAYRDEAYHWAQYPYNTPVPEGNGLEYSAYHYAIRASLAETAAANALESETNAAQSAQNAANCNQDAYDSAQTAEYWAGVATGGGLASIIAGNEITITGDILTNPTINVDPVKTAEWDAKVDSLTAGDDIALTGTAADPIVSVDPTKSAEWDAKEDGLGLPAGDNYKLVSDAAGNREWTPADLSGVQWGPDIEDADFNGVLGQGHFINVNDNDVTITLPDVEIGQDDAFTTGAVSTGFSSSSATIRVRIPASEINSNGDYAALVLKIDEAYELEILSAYIGEAASAGDDWDFAAAPTQLFFNGGESVFIPYNVSEVKSDIVEFDVDETKDYIVSFFINGTTSSLVANVNSYQYASSTDYSGDIAPAITMTLYSAVAALIVGAIESYTVNMDKSGHEIGIRQAGFDPNYVPEYAYSEYKYFSYNIIATHPFLKINGLMTDLRIAPEGGQALDGRFVFKGLLIGWVFENYSNDNTVKPVSGRVHISVEGGTTPQAVIYHCDVVGIITGRRIFFSWYDRLNRFVKYLNTTGTQWTEGRNQPGNLTSGVPTSGVYFVLALLREDGYVDFGIYAGTATKVTVASLPEGYVDYSIVMVIPFDGSSALECVRRGKRVDFIESLDTGLNFSTTKTSVYIKDYYLTDGRIEAIIFAAENSGTAARDYSIFGYGLSDPFDHRRTGATGGLNRARFSPFPISGEPNYMDTDATAAGDLHIAGYIFE